MINKLLINIVIEILLGVAVYMLLIDYEKVQKFWDRFKKWNPSLRKQRFFYDKLLGVILLLIFVFNFLIILKRIYVK